jgi:Flp pilus assembly pilin Flp
MKTMIARCWKEEEGVLSFEWTLLVTLLTIGVVAGLAGARDAIIDELGDIAQGLVAVDQSYTVSDPLFVASHELTAEASGTDSAFQDAAAYTDCTRLGASLQQPTTSDVDS